MLHYAKYWYIFVVLAISGCSSFNARTTKEVGFNNKAIYYSPWNWAMSKNNALTINPGAYFKTIFTGKTCILNFDQHAMGKISTQVAYRVSGGPWIYQDASDHIKIIIPANTTSWPNHLLEVIMKSSTEKADRWNGELTALKFKGLTIEDSANVKPPPIFPKKIIYIGDSITEGVRTLNVDEQQDNDAKRNDVTLTWDYELSQNLGAECGIIGFGGSGLNATGSGNVPALSESINYIYKNFKRIFTPVDLLVFHEGTNDGKSNTTAPFGKVLNIIASTRAVPHIIVLRPFNGTDQEIYLKAGIANSKAAGITQYFDTKDIGDFDSYDHLHPYGSANQLQIAPVLYPVFFKALHQSI